MSTKQLDKVFISDLLVSCIIGINAEERTHKQNVNINVVMYVDLSKSGVSDSIDDTVNYKTVKSSIVMEAERSTFFLVETLAQKIASICLAFPHVEVVCVRVEKPGALKMARSVGVEILRRKPEPPPP